MSQSQALQTAKAKDRDKIIEQVIAKGDLADLTPEQRISYHNHVCQSLGLNPLTRPFDFLQVFDKETNKTKIVLYANKDGVSQLKKNHGVSICKVETKTEDGCLIATAYARTPDGREDIDEGVVFVKGLASQNLANARMKAVTKAKRRVTLSICGLGFLDESEVDSIPGAQPIAHPEAEAVMTDAEADQLTIAHKASPLDQWQCGRALAMQVLTTWATLKTEGAEEETLRGWLPKGIESRKDLTEAQAQGVIKVFQDRLAVIRQARLDQWQCAPDLAIKLMMVYGELIAKGIDKTTIQQRLPGGIKSFKDLTEAQAQEALKALTHWLNTYNEVTKQGEGANNG